MWRGSPTNRLRPLQRLPEQICSAMLRDIVPLGTGKHRNADVISTHSPAKSHRVGPIAAECQAVLSDLGPILACGPMLAKFGRFDTLVTFGRPGPNVGNFRAESPSDVHVLSSGRPPHFSENHREIQICSDISFSIIPKLSAFPHPLGFRKYDFRVWPDGPASRAGGRMRATLIGGGRPVESFHPPFGTAPAA